MLTLLSALGSLLSFRVRSRASLELELVALRHQLTVPRAGKAQVCTPATSVAQHEFFWQSNLYRPRRGPGYALAVGPVCPSRAVPGGAVQAVNITGRAAQRKTGFKFRSCGLSGVPLGQETACRPAARSVPVEANGPVLRTFRL